MAALTLSHKAGMLGPTVDNLRSETVGERLRRLRVERGISQRDLASPGVSYAHISRIEAGTRQPSMKALRMLAQKLGVTPEYLETGAELPALQLRELRLAEQELRLRLDGEGDEGTLRMLLAQAEADSDLGGAARARILLGFAASARGEYASVIEHLSAALASELIGPGTYPDVYATLGQALSLAGDPDGAVALFEAALAELALAEPPNRPAEIRYATYLSYALTDRGEVGRARAVLAELWAGSEQVQDRYARIRLYWSLGRVALEEARPLAALDEFRRAVALLEATEDALQLARAHIACADAALYTGEDDESARDHLAEAERLLHPQAARADLSAIRRLRALEALRAGNVVVARAAATEALALSSGLPTEHGRAWWALALVRARSGEEGADEAFLEALALLRDHGGGREHADLLRAYGRFLRDQGRERAALEVFEEAAEAASNLGAERGAPRGPGTAALRSAGREAG